MNPRQVGWSLLSAAAIGLVGWVYSTSQRVTAVETQYAAINQRLANIEQDVRDVRNALLGPKAP